MNAETVIGFVGDGIHNVTEGFPIILLVNLSSNVQSISSSVRVNLTTMTGTAQCNYC